MRDTTYLEIVIEDLAKQVQAIDRDLQFNREFYKTAKLEKRVRLSEKKHIMERQSALIDELNSSLWYHPSLDTEIGE